jgi:hypothetical protein
MTLPLFTSIIVLLMYPMSSAIYLSMLFAITAVIFKAVIGFVMGPPISTIGTTR